MMRSSGVRERNYPEPYGAYVVQLADDPWRSSECSVSSSAPPAFPRKMNLPLLKGRSCSFSTMSQNASAKASCKVRYAMETQTSLANLFCTENGSPRKDGQCRRFGGEKRAARTRFHTQLPLP